MQTSSHPQGCKTQGTNNIQLKPLREKPCHSHGKNVISSLRNLLKVVTLFLQEPCIVELSGSTCIIFFLTYASYFTYNSKMFQPQQILFRCLHYEQNPQQLKRALTFANLLVLNSVHTSKTGNWLAAPDNSSSVL